MILLQIHQSQLFKMLVVALPLRRPKGTLAAPSQVPDQTAAYLLVYGTLDLAGIAERKIARPSLQVSVYLPDQLKYRYMTLLVAYLLTQRLLLGTQCLVRRGPVQISKIAAMQVAVVSECIAQNRIRPIALVLQALLDLIQKAFHPGVPCRCLCPLLPCRYQASPYSGGWPHPFCVTRPIRIRLR